MYRDYKILSSYTPATDKEVEEALIKEAKRKYKVGDRFKCLENGEISRISQLDRFHNSGNYSSRLWSDNVEAPTNDNSLLYKDGRWAEIIENKLELKGKDVKIEGNRTLINFAYSFCADGEIKKAQSFLKQHIYSQMQGKINRKDIILYNAMNYIKHLIKHELGSI